RRAYRTCRCCWARTRRGASQRLRQDGRTMSVNTPDPRDKEAVSRLMRVAILVLTLVTSCALGLLTPYVLVVLGMVVFAALLFRGGYPRALREDRAAQSF